VALLYTGSQVSLRQMHLSFLNYGVFHLSSWEYTSQLDGFSSMQKKRSNTIYGITPERIIIKTGIFSREVKSLNIRTLSDITIIQKADNSGTITLGPTDFRYHLMLGMELLGVKQPPKLEFIQDVKSVYDKIIDLQRQK
jgi:Bacterial PH domain